MDNKLLCICIAMLVSLLGCTTSGSSSGSYRSVGHVRWIKEIDVDARSLANNAIPKNAVSIFFLRADDNDALQTSANLAVNGRFQSSLQPNNFTQVYTCAGTNGLSSEITGHKNNHLLRGNLKHEMIIGNTYYFDVDVSDSGRSTITRLSAEDALTKMQDMNHQNHQISRVVNNCSPVSRIELKILFDTDKYDVKTQYYSEIERVVAYMNEYQNTSVELEGHTDSRASDGYNKRLSQNRVNEVKEILIQRYDIDASRVTSVGYGESRPIASNDNISGRKQNRRVVAAFHMTSH